MALDYLAWYIDSVHESFTDVDSNLDLTNLLALAFYLKSFTFYETSVSSTTKKS